MNSRTEAGAATLGARAGLADGGPMATWRWVFFGSGLLLGLLASIGMITTISMLYP